MGLLDDAIREHLDLKRRRGADPAEVERAEQEALGPVRRGPIEADPPELVLDEDHQPPEWEEDYTDEHEVPVGSEPAGAPLYPEPDVPLEPRPGVGSELFDDDGDPFGDEGPTEHEPPYASSPAAEPEYLHGEEPESSGIGAHYDEAHPAAEPFDEPVPPPHRAPLPHDHLGETVEYDVEEAIGEGGVPTDEHAAPPPPPVKKPPEGTEEDPLEETPEFLQETPDHDRLWFEQRPPRDFDFDG
jgi:hypothetical protein